MIYYQIINPKKICLTGDLNFLEEKLNRSKEDRKLDWFPESSIEYPDLVFTLKYNSGKCVRPCLRFEDNELKVVGNNIYFRAAKEANIKKLKFDLLLDRGLPLEDLMERYSLEFSPNGIRREYMQRFLFFKNAVRKINEEDPSIIISSLNSSKEFRKNHVLIIKF